jgi:hypothetical protein
MKIRSIFVNIILKIVIKETIIYENTKYFHKYSIKKKSKNRNNGDE